MVLKSFLWCFKTSLLHLLMVQRLSLILRDVFKHRNPSGEIYSCQKCKVIHAHRVFSGYSSLCVCQSSIHEQQEWTSPPKQGGERPRREAALCRETYLYSRRDLTTGSGPTSQQPRARKSLTPMSLYLNLTIEHE